VGHYPGTQRPRSFESHVSFFDPATGREQSCVISMNQPAKHGSYTLYQSSYRQSARGPAISYLSVSRDPGKPVVFAGYIAMMIGMLLVLWTRIMERRAKAAVAGSGRSVVLKAEA
ncbi:MAG: cytochrome c biogenesis protein ResB, partial [Planctomycetes bacterium]|nr:cytochrome c biogenesis protein ResB [Planctomycetota bacterium]